MCTTVSPNSRYADGVIVVQVADVELGADRLAAAFELELDRAADGVVGHLFERLELRDQLAVHAHQHVAGLQRAVARGRPAALR